MLGRGKIVNMHYGTSWEPRGAVHVDVDGKEDGEQRCWQVLGTSYVCQRLSSARSWGNCFHVLKGKDFRAQRREQIPTATCCIL